VLHPEDIERFRNMTPAERIELGFQLADMGWRFLRTLPPEEEQRRLTIARGRPWNPPPQAPQDR
jgi:hypothetical protein